MLFDDAALRHPNPIRAQVRAEFLHTLMLPDYHRAAGLGAASLTAKAAGSPS